MKTLTKSFHSLAIVAVSVLLATPVFAVPADPDAEVLALLQEINQHEIQAAEVAQLKSKINTKVDNYAKMMEKQHSKNLEQDYVVSQLSGIKPAETEAVVNQRNKSAQEMARLKGLNGSAFASAYIVAMVNGHKESLELLDAKAGQVQNKDIQKHVAETRGHMEHHLKEAQEVRQEWNRP